MLLRRPWVHESKAGDRIEPMAGIVRFLEIALPGCGQHLRIDLAESISSLVALVRGAMQEKHAPVLTARKTSRRRAVPASG